MAKVEMSLNEYDALKGELDFLKRVVKEVTTPKVDDWNLDYARNQHTETTGYAELTPEVKAYLEGQIKKNIPAAYQSDNFSAEVDFSNVTLIRVKYSEPDPEEVAEEQED